MIPAQPEQNSTHSSMERERSQPIFRIWSALAQKDYPTSGDVGEECNGVPKKIDDSTQRP